MYSTRNVWFYVIIFFYSFIRILNMPQVGSEQKPVIFSSKNKKKQRILGLTGKFYTKEEQSQYAEGWDRIFGGNDGTKKNNKKT